MNIIKQHIKLIISTIVVCILFSSCDNEVDLEVGEVGYLSFSLVASNEINSRAIEVPDTEINVYNTEGVLFGTYEYPEIIGTIVPMEAGMYRFEAHSTTTMEGAIFDVPSYGFDEDIEIKPFIDNVIDIEMTLSVVKVTVSYSDNLLAAIGDNPFSTVVDNRDGSTLDFVEIDSRVGYFKPTAGKLAYTFSVTLDNGKKYSLGAEVGVQEADHLAIHFDIDVESEVPENTMATIIINQTLNSIKTSLYLDLTNVTPPTITSEFDMGQEIEVRSGGALPYQFTINTASNQGLRSLYFNGDEALMEGLGLNRMQDLLNMDAVTENLFSLAGFDINIAPPVEDKLLGVSLNLDQFVMKLSPGDDGEQLYSFIIIAVDNYFNSFEKKFTIKMVGKRIIIQEVYSTPKGEDNVATADLHMTGEWTSSVMPTGTTFSYRKVGEELWQIVPTSEVEIFDQINKRFRSIIEVDQGFDYECQVVEIDTEGNIADAGDVILGQGVYNNFNVPNLGFDNWHNDGDNWYPNASGGNSYWASGNEGVTMFPVNKVSNCVPESTKIIKGRAAKLFTYTGIMVVKVAAGNIYTGTYKTDMGDPAASVKFGRPFTGRPQSLAGYFAYKSGGNVDGAPDKCHIYIELLNGSERVAYGEFKTDQTVNDYKHFEIDIDYVSENSVTTIVLVATSSHLGGAFKGASGSTLYVDEFELRY